MSDQMGEAPPPDAHAPQSASDPRSAEMRAVAEFQASLRTVTPRIGVIYALIVANVAVYLFMVGRGVPWMSPAGGDLMPWGANFGPRTLGGQPWRLATNVFLHFGALHLFMNMFALWGAGPLVERIFGPVRTAAVYAFAGACASFASVAVHPQVVSAGASGAVFGIYGALGAFLLRHRGTVPSLVLRRLGNVAGTFIVYNVIFGLSHPAIDNAAHLGGLAGGALAGALLARPLTGPRTRAPAAVAAVFVLSALIVLVAPRALKAPPDLMATLQRFDAAQTRVLGEYDALVARARAQELPDATFADDIERKILPEWREARRDLVAPRSWGKNERELLDRFDRYVVARERSLELLVTALRSQNPADLEAMKRAQEEVKRLVDQLNKQQKDQ
jgi:membrane associated rhomboid family serine protease